MIVKVHPLLEHQPFEMEIRGGFCYSLDWDMRNPPSSATCIIPIPNRRALTHADLSAHATQPSLAYMQIVCGVFAHSWPIRVHNAQGVTVRDVLEAIYTCLQTQYTSEEYNSLCEKQKSRVMSVVNARMQSSVRPQQTWEQGMKRIDSLLQHTHFGGLSIAYLPRGPVNGIVPDACVLSLRRPTQILTPNHARMPPGLY